MGEYRLNIGNKGHKVRGDGRGLAVPTVSDLDSPVRDVGHAMEKGRRDGSNGTPDADMLHHPRYRSAYLWGYMNGAWWRYARREWIHRNRTDIPGVAWAGIDLGNSVKDELFRLMFRPRYPTNKTTIWLA